MKNGENPSSQNTTLENIKNRRNERINKLAERLLNADKNTLTKYFEKTSSASITIGDTEHIVHFENFAEFLKRVQYALKQGRTEDFSHLIAIKEDIDGKRPLTQVDIELLEKYGLKHWSGVDISGKVMRVIEGYDMRNTNHSHTEIKGYISNSLFINISYLNVESGVFNNTVIGNISYNIINGSRGLKSDTGVTLENYLESYNWPGEIANNVVGGNISNNTVGGNISNNDIGGGIGENIIGKNIIENTIEGDISGNIIEDAIVENTVGKDIVGNIIQDTIENSIYNNTVAGKVWLNRE